MDLTPSCAQAVALDRMCARRHAFSCAEGGNSQKMAEVVESADDPAGRIPFPYFERNAVTPAGMGPNAGECGTQNAVFSGCCRSDGPSSHRQIDRPLGL
jgi:hypothetical protein